MKKVKNVEVVALPMVDPKDNVMTFCCEYCHDHRRPSNQKTIQMYRVKNSPEGAEYLCARCVTVPKLVGQEMAEKMHKAQGGK